MDNWTRSALDQFNELVKHLHQDRPLEIAQADARVILLAGKIDKLCGYVQEASRRLQT